MKAYITCVLIAIALFVSFTIAIVKIAKKARQ